MASGEVLEERDECRSRRRRDPCRCRPHPIVRPRCLAIPVREAVVVDDGSRDRTAELAWAAGVDRQGEALPRGRGGHEQRAAALPRRRRGARAGGARRPARGARRPPGPGVGAARSHRRAALPAAGVGRNRLVRLGTAHSLRRESVRAKKYTRWPLRLVRRRLVVCISLHLRGSRRQRTCSPFSNRSNRQRVSSTVRTRAREACGCR